jgi:hypothetical protein
MVHLVSRINVFRERKALRALAERLILYGLLVGSHEPIADERSAAAAGVPHMFTKVD